MTEPQYVRFGDTPPKGRSVHFSTGEMHAGVSCYRGLFLQEALFRIDTGGLTMQGLASLITLAACDWPAFFVEGEEVGTGPDGEPLVRVESARPVPRTTRITAISTFAQSALRLWSAGPRDGSGARFQQWRLRDGSPYVPREITFGVWPSPHAAHARRKTSGKALEKRKKRRKQARAQRKNR